MGAAGLILGRHHRCDVDSTIDHAQGPEAPYTGETAEGERKITRDHVLRPHPGGMGHSHHSDKEITATGIGIPREGFHRLVKLTLEIGLRPERRPEDVGGIPVPGK